MGYIPHPTYKETTSHTNRNQEPHLARRPSLPLSPLLFLSIPQGLRPLFPGAFEVDFVLPSFHLAHCCYCRARPPLRSCLGRYHRCSHRTPPNPPLCHDAPVKSTNSRKSAVGSSSQVMFVSSSTRGPEAWCAFLMPLNCSACVHAASARSSSVLASLHSVNLRTAS